MIHQIKMGFDTPTKEEAIEEAELLVRLRNLVSKKDIKMLIDLIKKDPTLVEMVRTYYKK